MSMTYDELRVLSGLGERLRTKVSTFTGDSMKRSLILMAAVAALSCASFGARVETIPYRAVLSGANEVPPVNSAATGAVNVFLHIVRDDAGKIVSGSVDFNVSYKFAVAPIFTAMHIHKGNAVTAGPVVIDSALPRQDSLPATGLLPSRQAQFTNSGTAYDAVVGILADPSQFYFNVHTTDNPGGEIRGQLQKAERGIFIGLMAPAKEVPAIAPPAATATTTGAVGTVTILRTFDSVGNLTSGWIAFDVNYRDLPAGRFTAMHIHTGGATVTGPVTLDSALVQSDVPDNGTGNLHFENELNVASFGTADALNRVFSDPGSFYINTHTTYAPGGYMRSQLRAADTMELQVTMSPANEVPPIAGSTATAASRVEVRTIRNADGTVAAGVVIFDENPRFPQGTIFTATHIHDQVAGQNGSVTIDAALPRDQVLFVDAGSGNITRQVTVSGGQALISLNDLILNPEKHYLNLHSVTNPGGGVRAQLAGAAVAPKLGLAISAITDINRTTEAPGSLMRIFGDNLMRVPSNVDAFPAGTVPTSVNGTTVSVNGTNAPILASSATEMVVQVPVEVTGTTAVVTVNTVGGSSAPLSVPFAASAPNIFFDSVGALVLKNSDYSLVRPANPAKVGDIVLVYATGLGQTTPALKTGQAAPDATYKTPTVSATVGGVQADVLMNGTSAPVIYSIASPGFIGLSQTAIQIPAGLQAGTQLLQLTVGTAKSNIVTIAVQ